MPSDAHHHHATGSRQNPSLTLLTSRKPYALQPSFFCSSIFWLNPSLLHCSTLSGFSKAQPRHPYASLASSQVLQHLQEHKHHLYSDKETLQLRTQIPGGFCFKAANFRNCTLKGGLMLLKALEFPDVLCEILARGRKLFQCSAEF